MDAPIAEALPSPKLVSSTLATTKGQQPGSLPDDSNDNNTLKTQAARLDHISQ
jgi:hypothetical protein